MMDAPSGMAPKYGIFHISCHGVLLVKIAILAKMVISPEVILGTNVKIQNNVSIYTGVTCDDDVFGSICVLQMSSIHAALSIVKVNT